MAEPIRIQIPVPLLAASQTWTMAAQDRLNTHLIRRIRPEVYATVGGTLYVEESDDEAFGSPTTLATITVTANTTPTTDWVKVAKKWYRLRYVNGGSAQTSRMTLWLEKDDRDVQDVEVMGSSALYDGTGSAPLSGESAAALTDQACNWVILQNDPDSTVDLMVGNAADSVPLQLVPGQSITVLVSNTNLVYVRSADAATAPTYNWIAG